MRGVASLTGSMSPTMVAKIVMESMIATPGTTNRGERPENGRNLSNLEWRGVNGKVVAEGGHPILLRFLEKVFKQVFLYVKRK